jgi:putative ABC transport system permease protein
VIDLALKILLHDRPRFVITVAGVAFAVMLVLVQVGLFVGLLESATVTIDHARADLWVTSRETPNVDFAHPFPEGALARVRSTAGVERADNLVVAYMFLTLPSGSEDRVIVYGVEAAAAWNLPWNVAEGRLADLGRGRFFFLDEAATRRFGRFTVGEYREVMGKRLRIAGRTAGARSFTTTPVAFMDYRLAQELSPATLRGNTDYVLVRLLPGADPEAVRAELRRKLPYNDVHTRAEWAARSRAYWVKNTGLGFNMALTVFLGCLVGVVVVAQTLYASTLEHLKEFGTVKAIGGSNRDVYRLLMRQAVVAALAGFAAGLLPALALVSPLARRGLELVITPGFITAAFIGTVTMCVAAALLSFRKVASIDPALVFRS